MWNIIYINTFSTCWILLEPCPWVLGSSTRWQRFIPKIWRNKKGIQYALNTLITFNFLCRNGKEMWEIIPYICFQDHRGGILKTAKFLGKDLSEDDVSQLMDHLSFQKMRQNPALNLEQFLQARNGPEFKQEVIRMKIVDRSYNKSLYSLIGLMIEMYIICSPKLTKLGFLGMSNTSI